MAAKPKNIVFKLIKFLYENFIIILPILVGANLLIQTLSSNDLTIYLFESEQVNERYLAKFEVYNEGMAISKYELIQPLVINLEKDNAIVDFDLIEKKPEAIKVWLSKLTSNKLKVDFDLLNESEHITFSILTKQPIEKFTVSSRIKNIEEVVTYHYQIKPKFYDRIGKFWMFLIVFSVITFIDAVLLVAKNKQLKQLLQHIDSISELTKKQEFIKGYDAAYVAYNLRFKRNKLAVKTDIAMLFDEITANNISQVKQKMKAVTKRAVLYKLRKPYLLISPVLFLISLIAIIGSIIFYATF
ncbi:MAG: hypothetical protein ACPGU9_04190 [Flavobacteriaceae bacterium]